MDEKKIKELMRLLEEAGVDAKLCDTPVPVYDNPVRCGTPADTGDVDLSEYMLLPKKLLGMHPSFVVPVQGDSMRDAGYAEGDSLRIRIDPDPRDGANVLAWIDGGCTVKTLFTDEDGTRWLVPQNEEYDAIRLTEDMDVRILGVVMEAIKAPVPCSSRQMLQSIRRTKNKQRVAKRLSANEVDARLVRLGGEVQHARQWYAVYRAMIDRDLMEKGDYQGFCTRVRTLLPEHTHLPDPKEISRMAVMSFAKPVAMWTEANAPVRGSRYHDYLRIAMFAADMFAQKSPEE